MMTFIVLVIALLGAALLQVQLPASALLGEARVPFLMAVVLYYGLTRGTVLVLATGLAAGFLQDTLSRIPLGYSSFCFCLAGWVANRFRRLVLLDSWLTPAFFGAAAGFLLTLFLYALLRNAEAVVYPAGRALVKALGTAALAAVTAPLVFRTLAWVESILGIARTEEVGHDFR